MLLSRSFMVPAAPLRSSGNYFAPALFESPQT
jgi:hypothetical protein